MEAEHGELEWNIPGSEFDYYLTRDRSVATVHDIDNLVGILFQNLFLCTK